MNDFLLPRAETDEARRARPAASQAQPSSPNQQPSSPPMVDGACASTQIVLGEYLLQQGSINSLQLEYALQKQKIEPNRLGNLLVEHGLASEAQVARFLAMQRNFALVDVTSLPPPESEVFTLFNRELCLTHGFLPQKREGDHFHVVLGNGEPRIVADLVQRRIGLKTRFQQGEFTLVAQAIRQHFYFAQHPIEDLLAREVRRLADDNDHAYSPERMLDHLLHLAVRERATDIHIAPAAASLHVLFRVDGVLRPEFALPTALNRLAAYIKLEAEMDVAEQRLPQDGSFSATVLDMPFTLRVSTVISEYGERMVLRILPGRSELGGLEELGYRRADVDRLRSIFTRPAGLILVTGPTGSGKSTTLHAALRMQSLIERNVVTIEDPVEYRVPGVCQTEVNRRAGYEFGSAMRHFLRHDPDVILVGEIRDAETAQAAMEAASTGHLVLSTLHVGGIFGIVPRLRLLGVDSESIAENLVTVINQRLVRRICPHCRELHAITAAERNALEELNTAAEALPEQLWHGCGCAHCRGSGYFGRLPVYEMFIVDRNLADAIGSDAPRHDIRAAATAGGYRSMLEMAYSRVLLGETTIAEVLRSVGSSLG
ncbi:MAG: Flp pilus assembly complex ATPase component TadA [Sterolibacterium sp.]|nr:Flp pilus assembly complex ATPase component TadA [Sterolibacterium sp.]